MFMKKLYSLFLTLFALLGAGFTTQAEEYTIQFNCTGGSSSGTAISATKFMNHIADASKTYVSGATDLTQVYAVSNQTAVKVGANKNPGSLTINLTDAGKVKATNITVYAKRFNTTGAPGISINNATVQSVTNSATDEFQGYSFDITDGTVLENIALSTGSSTKGAIYVDKIVVTYESTANLKDNGLFYSAETYTATVGEAYELPVLSNPNDLDVTYASSNTAVATISETGVVTIPENSVGETTISATFAGNDTYKAGKALYVLTVKNPNLPGYSAEKPFTVAQAIEACTADGPKDIYVKGIITSVESFNSTYGSLTYYIGDEAGATTTLQVYGGLNIDGEKFTGKDDLAVGGTVLVNGNLKLYANTPEIDLNSKVIEYTAPAMLTVDTPTFSINSGEVEKGTTVTIECDTEGATIRYAMAPNADDIDDSAVDSWEIYEGAIELTESTTIKAIAMKDGCINSSIASVSYTVLDPAKISQFDFTSPAELTPAQPASSSSPVKVSDVKFWSKSISFTASKGTSLDAQIYYTGTPNLRVYQGATITISSEDENNNNIISVVFGLDQAVENPFEEPSTEEPSEVEPTSAPRKVISANNNNKTYTWTGNADKVTLNVVKSIRINSVRVQCENVINAGVDNIVVDNDQNTPIEYYNLQGVRIENPAAGQLYIKRQGSKATKVIIR